MVELFELAADGGGQVALLGQRVLGATGVVALVWVVACTFAPDIPEGTLACGSAGECPPDLFCAPDKRCRQARGTVLDISGGSIAEGPSGETVATIRVELSQPAPDRVRVAYAALAGTATAGVDFVMGRGVLDFAPGVTKQAFDVIVLGDEIPEASETVLLGLEDAEGASIGVGEAMLTIIDDDSSPALDAGSDSTSPEPPCPAVCNGGCQGGTCQILRSAPSPATCPTGQPCHVTCTGVDACNSIDCASATSCVVECTKKNACQGTIDCGTSACRVQCGPAKDACKGATLSAAFASSFCFGCSGDSGCNGMACSLPQGGCIRECSGNSCSNIGTCDGCAAGACL
jgi:hypothetical protein